VNDLFTAVNKKTEDLAKKSDIDRIIQMMDELTRKLDISDS
jgi:hypothetical protein